MKNILITNGHLYDPGNGVDLKGDLYVAAGKIAALGEVPSEEIEDTEGLIRIDAQGKKVIPGLVDMCVSLREPGFKQKGTFRTELHAAVRGGVTSLCSHPLSRPVNDAEAITRLILDKSEEENRARVFPVAAATKGAEGQQLSEYQGLQKAGCVAVCHSRDTLVASPVMRRSFQYASTHDSLVVVEPDDPELAADGCINEGALSSRLGLVGIPEIAETLPLSRALMLAEETGARLHIGQISCSRSVEMIAEAKARGVPVSCDVSIHHLMLTEDDIEDFNPEYYLRPPLRSSSDRQALLNGVRNGTIDAIVSQHLPHELAAKQAPFAEAEVGASGVEYLLSLAVSLQQKEDVPESAIISALTNNPASLIGIGHYGLEKGNVADICIFDETAKQTISVESFSSLGTNSPYINESVPGVVEATIVAGGIVYSRSNEIN